MLSLCWRTSSQCCLARGNPDTPTYSSYNISHTKLLMYVFPMYSPEVHTSITRIQVLQLSRPYTPCNLLPRLRSVMVARTSADPDL